MTCLKYPPMLSRLLDRELSSEETAEVEAHLAGCESCRRLVGNWELQSSHLRGHLARHTVGEEFIAKVIGIVSESPSEDVGVADVSRRVRLLRWLPAAAAVVVTAVLLAFFFASRDSVGYARVIDPGELEVLHSTTWVRATAGEVLHPGEWLRNPLAGAAEIQWHSSCRLTLEPGTLAHIPEAPLQSEVVLIRGTVISEIEAGNQELRVRTPAGSVAVSAGRFTVHVADIALPRLEVAADGSETVTGTVVSIGEIKVQDGTVRVYEGTASRELRSGGTTVFCEPSIAAPVTGSLEGPLHVVSETAGRGTLTESLASAADGLFLKVEAANISLKKLLEWTTAAGVHGGEDTHVTGTLRLPVNARLESVAAELETLLRVPISLRQETIRQSLAAGERNSAPASDWIKGEFSFQKSLNGVVSLDFRSVPAAQAFRILRAAVSDMPEAAAGTESLSVTLRAAALGAQEASLWVGKTLGMELKPADQQIDILEVGTRPGFSPNVRDPETPESQDGPAGQPSSVDVRSVGNTRSTAGTGTRPAGDYFPEKTAGEEIVVPDGTRSGRPLWSVLDGRISDSGLYVAAPAIDSSVITGKATPKQRDFIGDTDLVSRAVPSTHLTWPTVGQAAGAGKEPFYVISNALGVPAHAIWSGYSEEGDLIAQFEMLVSASSSLTLDPDNDLPAAVGPGGHWELASNVPLVGFRESGDGTILGLPVEGERLVRTRSYPSSALNILGARLWLVNPAETKVQVLVLATQNRETVSSELWTIPAHGGIRWPDAAPGASHRIPGAVITVHVLNGSIALGIDK